MSDLTNKNILITSGPTRSYLDAVRYISNRSTGMLGSKIAIEALRHGAIVTLIYGKGSIIPDIKDMDETAKSSLTLICIETNEELVNILENRLKNINFDIVIHAMAVLDYLPEKITKGKRPSTSNEWEIRFIKAAKVIKLIKKIWPDSFLVGFKLEVDKKKDELINNAYSFLRDNKADLVVANDLKEIRDGNHKAYIINKDGITLATYNTKDQIASGLISILSQQG